MVKGTGDEDDWRFDNGKHRGTALPEELQLFVFVVKCGTEPAGAVRINLEQLNGKPYSYLTHQI